MARNYRILINDIKKECSTASLKGNFSHKISIHNCSYLQLRNLSRNCENVNIKIIHVLTAIVVVTPCCCLLLRRFIYKFIQYGMYININFMNHSLNLLCIIDIIIIIVVVHLIGVGVSCLSQFCLVKAFSY